ncbi:hypothetical protein NA57DRAFT_75794 [Rhizodiscina lignyota]|uniref:Small ribosomal subunit protein mS41 n=1 Tax=Rhizodiscina lignyota TaxID=1504668 RepID=A0A9P4IBJ5_9PEZI|nr:hypothetical protein NA57DRAFT_75794 [Rhizodiscina lignyota]
MFAPRSFLSLNSQPIRLCIRCYSRSTARPVPPPTPFIPDTKTFLKVIGRDLSQHAAKIPSWEALFRLTSLQLKELGVEPPRARKYLLWWREKFRRGDYGVGGDLTEVTDGVGEMRVFEVPVPETWAKPEATATRSAGMRKVALNVPLGEEKPRVPLGEVEPVKFVKIRNDHSICGPHIQPVKGTQGYAARIAVKEGLWEEKRGHKIDGGERRKAMVRAERRAQERKAQRAAA